MVEDRERLGDIEVELMVKKAYKSALVLLVGRVILRTVIEKVPNIGKPL